MLGNWKGTLPSEESRLRELPDVPMLPYARGDGAAFRGGGVRTPFHSLFIFKSFGGVGGAICCLRDTPDLFIGISPAHDEWQILAASPSLSNARCGRTNSRRVATPYG